jgi:hypothetical protein
MKINITKSGRTNLVRPEILSNWKLSYRHGDIARLSNLLGISRGTIVKALKGEAKQCVQEAITKFYNQ